MALLSTVWSTDEDVYTRVTTDFFLIVPPSGILAQAADGALGAPDAWTLSSATVNFASIGVKAGHIVRLGKPVNASTAGLCLVVEAVNPSGTVTLRRPKAAAGFGMPPVATSASGVAFSVLTLGPQVEQASYSINRIFGVDPQVVGRSPSDLYDARQLEEATSLRAIADAYWAASKQESGDDFKAKAKVYGQRATDAEDRINLIWQRNNRPQQQSSKFNTRITR